jgi:hypothetical protein
MAILDYFIGASQSKYAAIAIFSAIVIICIAILFTNTEVPFGNKISIVFFVLLMSIIPVGLSLFELTCIVTGGKNNKFNLCHVFAWFVAIMIIVYCFILIILTLMSMFTYKKAIHKINHAEIYNNVSKEDAEIIAKNMIESGVNVHEAFGVPKPTVQVPPVSPQPVDIQPTIPSPPVSPQPVVQPSQPMMVQQSSDSSELLGYDSSANFMEFDKTIPEPKRETFVNKKKDDLKNAPEPFTSDDSYAPLQ